MPSLKSIRKRISSVKSTQKITRAMKMVAGARLNRAQQRIMAIRPYAHKTQAVLHSVARSVAEHVEEGGSDGEEHTLLEVRPEKNALFVVLTGDRGLCGSFNINVGKLALGQLRSKEGDGIHVALATIGKKGRDYMQRHKAEMLHHFAVSFDAIEKESAQVVASWIIDRFTKAEVDSVYLIYNEFKSAMTQIPTMKAMLPIVPPGQTAETSEEPHEEYIFEPNRQALLERLVPMYVEISVRHAMLESYASEQAARMTAMDSATRNASDMISRLTLQYNRARQAAITKELMEIIGGAEALKE